MPMKMDSDLGRFHKIVRGKIKRELHKFIANGDLIGRQGGKTITIPLPRIEVPRFQFGDQQGGVGQGEGEVGDPLASDQQAEQAGNSEGQQSLEVDVTLDELADLLGEELRLPNIKDRGAKNIEATRYRYTGVHRKGPESLRHFKRTFRETLKRSIISGTYDENEPLITPIKDDRRYRSFRELSRPETNAVIIYMMDVSGSMDEEQKKIVRLTSFWLDTWLTRQYRGLEKRYIVHDAIAREVDQDTFYRTKESGGTLISSAYQLALAMMDKDYPANIWNIYLFHFSDGDNWSGNDTAQCLKMMQEGILPASNLFSYGQVESRYGSGQFLRDLEKNFSNNESVALAKIKDREAIIPALKIFLGRGV